MVSSKPEKKLKEAIDEYMRNKAVTVGSEQTVQNAAWALSDFFNFYIGEKTYMPNKKWNYSDPSFTTVQAWRDSLIERGLARSTVREYLVRLHTFFEYACDPEGAHIYEKNPVSKRLFPDVSKIQKLPYKIPLTNEQISLLWKNERPFHTCKPVKNWARDYAIIMLILTSKIRNTELRELTPKDLDWENGEIEVNCGKGSKYRRIEFSEIAQQAVKIYLKSGLRPDTATDDEVLFGTEYSNHRLPKEQRVEEWHALTRDALSKMIDHHVEMITGVKGVTSHDLRHVGAYLDLNNGKSLELLQAELGHANPQTTQIYSGKLTAKRNRGSVKLTMEEQEYQIRRNQAILLNYI